jgi:hypothetical protein
MTDLTSSRLEINDVIRALNNIDIISYPLNPTQFGKYSRCKDILDTFSSASAITSLNAAFKPYISQGGISQTIVNGSDSTDPIYTNARNAYLQAMGLINAYDLLNRKLSNLLSSTTNDADASAKLATIGTLQASIKTIKEEIKSSTSQLDIAQSRQSTVENPRSKISYYQGFASRLGFIRPFHKSSIPILMGIGLLCLFLSALVLRELLNPVSTEVSAILTAPSTSSVMGYFGGIAIAIIILIILAVYGYLGKL